MRDLRYNGETFEILDVVNGNLTVIGSTSGTFYGKVKYPYYFEETKAIFYTEFTNLTASLYAYDYINERFGTYTNMRNYYGSQYIYARRINTGTYGQLRFDLPISISFDTIENILVTYSHPISALVSGTALTYNLITLANTFGSQVRADIWYDGINNYERIYMYYNNELLFDRPFLSHNFTLPNIVKIKFTNFYIEVSIYDSYDREILHDAEDLFLEIYNFGYNRILFGATYSNIIRPAGLFYLNAGVFRYAEPSVTSLMLTTVNTIWANNVYANISRAKGLSGTLEFTYATSPSLSFRTSTFVSILTPALYFNAPPILNWCLQYNEVTLGKRYATSFKDPNGYNLSYSEPSAIPAYVVLDPDFILATVSRQSNRYKIDFVINTSKITSYDISDFLLKGNGTLVVHWHLFGA